MPRDDRDPEHPAILALYAFGAAFGTIGIYLLVRYGWALANLFSNHQ